MTARRPNSSRHAFSLIEVLLVLAIISIMAALVINAFSNAAQDSRKVIARQQQAALQSAVSNWTSAQIGRKVTVDQDGDGTPDDLDGDGAAGDILEMTVAITQGKYNYSTNWWTATPTGPLDAVQRLALVSDYLDADTLTHLTNYSPAGDTAKLRSRAMKKNSYHLELPKWEGTNNTYPKVDLIQP